MSDYSSRRREDAMAIARQTENEMLALLHDIEEVERGNRLLQNANCGAAFFLGQVYGSIGGCACALDEYGEHSCCPVVDVLFALATFPDGAA